MPDGLFTTDPIIAQNFFLEIDGTVMTSLMSVSGLDVEVSVATAQQVGKDGKQQIVKTLGGTTNVGDLTLTRVAPAKMADDKLWGWFNDIRNGEQNALRTVTIQLQNEDHTDIAMTWRLLRARITKISGPELNAQGNEVAIEEVVISHERLEID